MGSRHDWVGEILDELIQLCVTHDIEDAVEPLTKAYGTLGFDPCDLAINTIPTTCATKAFFDFEELCEIPSCLRDLRKYLRLNGESAAASYVALAQLALTTHLVEIQNTNTDPEMTMAAKGLPTKAFQVQSITRRSLH